MLSEPFGEVCVFMMFYNPSGKCNAREADVAQHIARLESGSPQEQD